MQRNRMGTLKEMLRTNHPVTFKILRICSKSPFNYGRNAVIKIRDRMIYQYTLWTNKPYFGPVMLAYGPSPLRIPYMEKVVELEIANSPEGYYKVMEIGSWVGGSAIVWAEALKKLKDKKGLVVCVDAWESYLGQADLINTPQALKAEKALANNKIYKLFCHNIRSAGHSDVVETHRGKSDKVLPTLSDHEFNLVFVDGGHSYTQVFNDLKNSARLICDNEIICGDDLELQKIEIDGEAAEKHKELDSMIFDKKANINFHPGVTLAVGEFFGEEVSCYKGFWAMRKVKSGWQKVDFPSVS